MRRRLGSLSILCLLGLAIWGCGPPQVIPMTPPGVPYQKVTTDTMEAVGEVQSRGSIQPPGVAPGKASPPTSPPEPGPKPAEKLGPLR